MPEMFTCAQCDKQFEYKLHYEQHCCFIIKDTTGADGSTNEVVRADDLIKADPEATGSDQGGEEKAPAMDVDLIDSEAKPESEVMDVAVNMNA